MAEKTVKVSSSGQKPVPMKFFSTWEVEKSTPNCIPRLCTLTLTRLVIRKPLENELQSVLLAVKMHNTKRVLRSNEIILSSVGTIDTELDLTFSLQYPHFLKREGNKLHIMLQRRKKYKNRTILGYKTLAMGQISMAQVLQRPIDRQLQLYADTKDQSEANAEVNVMALASQPVDDTVRRKKVPSADRSPEGDSDEEEGDYSSNEDLSDSDPTVVDDERNSAGRRIKARTPSRQRNLKQKFIALLNRFKVSEEVLDSEQDQDDTGGTNPRDIEELFDELENMSESDPDADSLSVLSTPRPKLRPFFTGKGSTEVLDKSEVSKETHGKNGEDVGNSALRRHTDSDTNIDMNLLSAVASEQVLAHNKNDNGDTPPAMHKLAVARSSPLAIPGSERKISVAEGGVTRDPSPASLPSGTPPTRRTSKGSKSSSYKAWTERPHTVSARQEFVDGEPRKALLDCLATVMPVDDALPDSIILINTSEWQGQMLAQYLDDPLFQLVPTCSFADVKATISCIVSKIQKFCHSNARTPSAVKVVVAGGDGYVNMVLWPYVEQLASKSPDWQNYIHFLLVPLGTCSIAKYLCQIDPKYNSLFGDLAWRELFEKSDNISSSRHDVNVVAEKVSTYISNSKKVIHLPIGEAMLNYCKDSKHGEEESTQTFMPFLNEARIGSLEFTQLTGVNSIDTEDPVPLHYASTSPPQGTVAVQVQAASTVNEKNHNTPPNSPNVPITAISAGHQGGSSASPNDFELLIDYWTIHSNKTDSSDKSTAKKDSKISLKTTFRSLLVYRLPPAYSMAGNIMSPCGTATGYSPSMDVSASLTLMIVTKEKKQKIIRLGKKTKDVECKSQVVEGVQRLICSPKNQNQPLTVVIDGVEWTGVKFFQLSSQWQTAVKNFPILVFGLQDS